MLGHGIIIYTAVQQVDNVEGLETPIEEMAINQTYN